MQYFNSILLFNSLI